MFYLNHPLCDNKATYEHEMQDIYIPYDNIKNQICEKCYTWFDLIMLIEDREETRRTITYIETVKTVRISTINYYTIVAF